MMNAGHNQRRNPSDATNHYASDINYPGSVLNRARDRVNSEVGSYANDCRSPWPWYARRWFCYQASQPLLRTIKRIARYLPLAPYRPEGIAVDPVGDIPGGCVDKPVAYILSLTRFIRYSEDCMKISTLIPGYIC